MESNDLKVYGVNFNPNDMIVYDARDSGEFSDARFVYDSKQVMKINQLKVYGLYQRMRNDPVQGLVTMFNFFEVLELDNPVKNWYLARSFTKEGNSFEVLHSMEDEGIIPYQEGLNEDKWNVRNYLVRVDEGV